MKLQYKWFLVIFFIFLGLLLSACQQNRSIPTGNAEETLVGSEDFNRDAKDDLAIGVPKEDVNGDADAGAVNVIYGSYTDLTSAADQIWHQDEAGISGSSAEPDDQFGYSLAIGDFDGNGKNDLAVGMPFEDEAATVDAGSVHIIYGYDNRLTEQKDMWLHQDSAGVDDFAETGDQFGYSLAVGDFNDDGKDDLAVGIPYEDLGGLPDVGAIQIFYGSDPNGLNMDKTDLFLDQTTVSNISSNESNDKFGWSLTSADFNGDGKDDLAVGTPFEDFVQVNSGIVDVIYGDKSGLNAGLPSAGFRQGAGGILGTTEAGDHFGYTLTACDYNYDGRADLAIGAHLEDIGNVEDAGAIHVLYGSNNGIATVGNQLWHQNKNGILDSVEEDDSFGQALTSGDFNGDGACDLAVGAPHERISGQKKGGVVNVLYGSSTGIVATGNQLWHQNIAGIKSSVQTNDRFGWSLAAGDFNGDKKDDLAIGVPYKNLSGGVKNAGAVSVIYGSITGLSALGDDIWHQDKSGVEEIAEANDNFGWALAAKR